MTPTEAAAVAAFYGLFIGLFVYKEFSVKTLISSFVDTCLTSAIVIALIAMAKLFGNILTIEQIPATVTNFILGLTSNKILILLLINILLLFVGTFMEALAAIVILVPILLPIAVQLGVHPVHFGVLMVVNLAIGFVTPPVGVNLFVASSVIRAKIGNVANAALPLVGVMILVLLLITYIPSLIIFS